MLKLVLVMIVVGCSSTHPAAGDGHDAASPDGTVPDASLPDALEADAAPADLSGFDFNRVIDCIGAFDYEKVFLLKGRESALVPDPEATQLMLDGSMFFGPLKPVTQAYSVELFASYVHHAALEMIADRVAIALIEQESGLNDLEHGLVLMISEGARKGHVVALHSATLDLAAATFSSDRFSCTVAP
jgi:hypothetical protein